MKQSNYRNVTGERGEALGHLRIIKGAPQLLPSVEHLRQQYDRHLDQVAGLTEATRLVYWLFIGQFLEWHFGRRPLRLTALRAKHITGFIEHSGPRLQCSSQHVLAAALRSFLSFLYFTGQISVALVNAEVTARTAQLLAAVSGRRNFVVSSGCDVPPSAPLANLDAFYQAVNAVE